LDKKRKTARLSNSEIPVILRKPILLYNYEEVKSTIENLSPLGIGLIVDKNAPICAGDFFYLKYYDLDSDIKCLCVYSEVDGEIRNIGAYFTEPEDQKVIMTHLYFQYEN
jgi:hypothetical protein